MASWFTTKKEANAEIKARKRKSVLTSPEIRVFKWTHTKRKKPFFVGDPVEWLNE